MSSTLELPTLRPVIKANPDGSDAPLERVEPSRRLPGLDGLRAFAIASVILFHVAGMENFDAQTGPLSVLTRFASAGWAGVDLFFVLSGFLITRILLNSKGKDGYFRIFYARRSLRIFPLYYLYVALVTVVLPLLHRPGTDYWQSFHVWDRASVLFYFYNLRFFITHQPLVLVSHFWSLALEEQFYMVWPFLVAKCNRRQLAWIAAVGIAVAFGNRIANDTAGWLPPGLKFTVAFGRMDGLFVGAILALVYRRQRYWSVVSRWAPTVLLLSGAILAGLAAYQRSFAGVLLVEGVTPLSVFFGALLVLVLQEGALSRFLDSPILRRVGLYSYGIYMLHWLVEGCAGNALHHLRWLSHHPIIQSVLLFVMTFSITTALAALSFHLFEAKLLRYKPGFKTLSRTDSLDQAQSPAYQSYPSLVQ
jgi:peptidoglycan/LPS O-acetylase OafA/YrhL